MHQIHPFRTRKGDDGFNPRRIQASKGDTGFRRAGRLVYRTHMRYPWPVAGPGRATSGRPTLQTSSNQHDSHRLARTSVTNVVNLSPKTSIFTEKADGLTTFVTTGQKSTRKTPWIDDVCNNTHQTTPKHCNSNVANSMFEQVAGELRAKLMGDGRARPGFETTHRATSATRPHWCEGRRRDRRARAGFEARRRTK